MTIELGEALLAQPFLVRRRRREDSDEGSAEEQADGEETAEETVAEDTAVEAVGDADPEAELTT